MPGRLSWCVLALLPLLVALGCSGSGRPVKVNGVVTLDGKPLPNAMVSFINEDEKGPPANGGTGSDGTFRLTTYSSGDGALPGTYKVTVSLAPEEEQVDLASGERGSDPAKMMAAMKAVRDKARKPGPKKANLHPTYSDLKKTTLKQIIPSPDGKVVLDLKTGGG